MSEKTRLRFRRIEAELLKAFHRGFSLLLAVFIFGLSLFGVGEWVGGVVVLVG